MFPEHRELVSHLKANDGHFGSLCNKHQELDQKIRQMGTPIDSAVQDEIEVLKKKKLRIKDEIYELLRKAGAS